MNLRKSFVLVTLVSLFVLSHAVCAAALTDAQRVHIDRYLAGHGLNEYGDARGTVYVGGNPLFREETGTLMDRHEFVLHKLPQALDGFVTTLPFDGAGRAVATKQFVSNDFDSRRLQDRFVDAALRAEEKTQALFNQIRAALDERNFKAVDLVLRQLDGMAVTELRTLAPVLKDARRMLNAECIQDLDVTRQVRDLLVALDKLEAKLAA